MRHAILAVALFGWLLPAAARAEHVKIDVKVVEASHQGSAIDPKLHHLENELRHLGVSFTSYKLVSDVAPILEDTGATDVALPDGKTLKLSLEGVDKVSPDKAKVKMHLAIPGVLEQGYTTSGRGGRYTLVAFSRDHGKPSESQVIVVITHTVL